jgi:hypothetical protein
MKNDFVVILDERDIARAILKDPLTRLTVSEFGLRMGLLSCLLKVGLHGIVAAKDGAQYALT